MSESNSIEFEKFKSQVLQNCYASNSVMEEVEREVTFDLFTKTYLL